MEYYLPQRFAAAVVFLLALTGAARSATHQVSSSGWRSPLSHLLLDIRQEKQPAIKVRHLEKSEYGDLIAETAHFRFVFRKNPAMTEKIARTAELSRRDICNLWFGDQTDGWDQKCTFYLYASHAEYAKKTKSTGSAAHTRTRMAGKPTIHLPCDLPDLYEDVIPHEVTHAVMAVWYDDMPRWAHEGIASLSESRPSRERLRKLLEISRQKDELFSTEILMHTAEARHTDSHEYYAQCTSLVEFFIAEKGRKTFLRFVDDGVKTSYEAALKKHYDMDGFTELHRRWTWFAFPLSEPSNFLARRR